MDLNNAEEEEPTASSPATPLLGSQQPSQALNTESQDDDNRQGRTRTLSFFYRRALTPLRNVIVDERGTGWPVVLGLMTLVLMGTLLGAILPGDSDLPSRSGARFFSNAIGYTYFMSWSISFYPQVISNFRRKSTVGLSPDFCCLNVIGFGCYTIYNAGLFFNKTIQQEYRDRHGQDAAISVQSNDVAFAVHAFALASLTLGQIGYYNGGFHFRGEQSSSSAPSKVILGVAVLFLAAIALGPLVVLAVHRWEWLDYLYMLGNIKVMITLMKYIPQVILNYQRKSTTGWSIWNIILDFTGGTLSDVQLVLDCAVLNDWTGITGNLTKLALGSVSVIFDLLFMLQHYILYPDRDGEGAGRDISNGDDGSSSPSSGSVLETEPLAAIDDRTL